MASPSEPLAIENYLFAVFPVKKKPRRSSLARFFGFDKRPEQDTFTSRADVPMAVFRKLQDAKLFRDMRRARETGGAVDYRIFQLDVYSSEVAYVDAGHL